MTAALRAEPLEVIDVLRGVHALELGAGRPPGFEAATGVARRPGVEPLEHGPDAGRAFRVAPTGIVFLEVGIGCNQKHAARLTNDLLDQPFDGFRRYARRR